MAEVILFEKLSWQVRLWVFAFHELLQSSLHPGLRKQVAEDIDLLPQVLIGNRLDEFFGHACRVAIKLAELGSGTTRRSEGLAFGQHWAHQPSLLSLRGIQAAAGEQQISHDCVARSRFSRGMPPNP